MNQEEKIIVALIGLPCVGKSRVAEFLQDAGASCYSWGDFAQKLITSHYGDCNWSSVVRFTEEIEASDPTIVAREFLKCSNIADNPNRVVVVDGVKCRAQLQLLVQSTNRTPLVIGVIRDEEERQEAIRNRGEFDDSFDLERVRILTGIGLLTILAEADMYVDLTGIRMRKADGGKWWIRLPRGFVQTIAKALSDLGLKKCESDGMYEWLVSCAEERAIKAGYEPLVDHSLIMSSVSP